MGGKRGGKGGERKLDRGMGYEQAGLVRTEGGDREREERERWGDWKGKKRKKGEKWKLK